MPNASPKMQNSRPQTSSWWPSIPHRNRTWDRSGSFRLASPPGLSSAMARPAPISMHKGVKPAAKNFARRDRTLLSPVPRAVASLVRISNPPSFDFIRDFSGDLLGNGLALPPHRVVDRPASASPPSQSRAAPFPPEESSLNGSPYLQEVSAR